MITRLRANWPHIAFWICFASVFLNVFVAFFAPTQDLSLEGLFRAGGFGLLALVFWVGAHKAEGET